MAVDRHAIFSLNTGAQEPLKAVRRKYALQATNPRIGETVYKTIGEYLIYQPDGPQWQLLPTSEYDPANLTRTPYKRWESAETLRTRAGLGLFACAQMDALEVAVVQDQRITNASNRLTVASEDDLHVVLRAYDIEADTWEDTGVRDLFGYIDHGAKVIAENVTLHDIDGKLWLASAQTMLNVFRKTAGGAEQLRETEKVRFDMDGNPGPAVQSEIRSSMGETGHLIDDQPERPFDTAWRGLREELSIKNDGSVTAITATGSLLRQKVARHHRFPPIGAEDHTHYFDVLLDAESTQEAYLNEERNPTGQVHSQTTLEWFPCQTDLGWFPPPATP